MSAWLHLRGFLAAGLLAAPVAALAQGDNPGDQLTSFQLQDNSVLIVSADGHVITHAGANPDIVTHALRKATPLGPGSIVLVRDGKLYLARDHRMKSGEMMSDALTKPGK